MRNTPRLLILLGCFGLTLGGAWLAVAGDLDPPAGPVAPTMHTLDEIHEAALASGGGGSGGCFGGCIPGDVGDERYVGAALIDGIPGSDLVFDNPDAVKVIGLSHMVHMPVDDQGQPSGIRLHGQLTITKNIDKATVLLYQAWATGQHIPEVEIKMYREAPGEAELYYTITLENVIVTVIETDMPVQSSGMFAHLEKVSFAYQRITWEWVPEAIVFQDDVGARGR
ncbi:MAG: type VI secretion system tube protein Hcp [Phycisphaerales bacterium]|nr:type VI secretion system tube protein Hcp [Phycisphaerales bacterium]